MRLEPEERTRLVKHDSVALGRGAMLGSQVWDVQHKFRIEIGPLSWPAFQAFLPSGQNLPALQAMVRQYVGHEFTWDLRLQLQPAEVPAWPLGRQPGIGMLGRSAWLDSRRPRKRADQLIMNVESICRVPLGPSLAPSHLR